jgi:hypothetical protein
LEKTMNSDFAALFNDAVERKKGMVFAGEFKK